MMTDIVMRAMVYTVTSIGQLSKAEIRELDTAVRKGWISKGKGGAFPILKTVYAHPGFDFAADRAYHVKEFQISRLSRQGISDVARAGRGARSGKPVA